MKVFLQLVILSLAGVFLFYMQIQNQANLEASLDQKYALALAPMTVLEEPYKNPRLANKYLLPKYDIVSDIDVPHLVFSDSIKDACIHYVCGQALDYPEFITVADAAQLLSGETTGIALSHKNEQRFYPFDTLKQFQIINDVIAGDPVLITYSPLTDTGVAFNPIVDGVTFEFDVAGMLWQADSLFYNRASSTVEQSIWSPILGTAIVGKRSGEKLSIIPTDRMNFQEWSQFYTSGSVLSPVVTEKYDDTDYQSVVAELLPQLISTASEVKFDAQIHGVTIGGQPAAFVSQDLITGTSTFEVNDQHILVVKNILGEVVFMTESNEYISDIEGLWFSWKAAYPDSIVWSNESVL